MTDEPITAVTQWLLPCPCCDGREAHDPECTFAEDCPADHERLSAEWERIVGACHEARLAGARQMRERAAQRFRNHSWIVAILSTLPDEPEPCDGTDAGLGCDCGGPHGEER